MDKSIHNNSYKAVMNLLRNKRIERSITQEKMAELLEISQATLRRSRYANADLTLLSYDSFVVFSIFHLSIS